MWLSKDGLLQTEMQSNSFPFFSKNHENKLAPNTELLTTVTDKLKRELKLQNFHRSLLEVISSAELQWNAQILYGQLFKTMSATDITSTPHFISQWLIKLKRKKNNQLQNIIQFHWLHPMKVKMMTHWKMHLTIQAND